MINVAQITVQDICYTADRICYVGFWVYVIMTIGFIYQNLYFECRLLDAMGKGYTFSQLCKRLVVNMLFWPFLVGVTRSYHNKLLSDFSGHCVNQT